MTGLPVIVKHLKETAHVTIIGIMMVSSEFNTGAKSAWKNLPDIRQGKNIKTRYAMDVWPIKEVSRAVGKAAKQQTSALPSFLQNT